MHRRSKLLAMVCAFGAVPFALAATAPEATSLAGPSRAEAGDVGVEPGPGNGSDACSAAPLIVGPGLFAFSTIGATTDGQPHVGPCTAFGDSQVSNDIWWRWASTCNGVVTIDTCGLTTMDSKLAVYAPLPVCPPSATYLLACNDDACSTQSRVSFVAIAGQEYLIRLGNFAGTQPGTGSIRISCNTPGICTIDSAFCQDVDYSQVANTSNNVIRVADNFNVQATGAIASICWRGGSFSPVTDNFRIAYYHEASNGRPGLPIASFSQAAGSLTVTKALTGGTIPSNLPEEEYSACHAPVPVQRGVPYWVEIRNQSSTAWFWASSASGDAFALQDSTPNNDNWGDANTITDRAFCLGLDSECANDTNGDGQINFADLNNIISNFNTSCP